MSRKSLFDLINNAKKEEKDYASEFLTDLTYSIEKWDKQHKREPSASLTPSSMKCIRSMVFKLLGTPVDDTKTSYQLIGICENGTNRHETLQKMIYHMKDIGIDCEYVDVEQYVKEHDLPLRIGTVSDFENGEFETHLYSDKYRVSFLCDGIIKYKGKYFILEIKTESSGKFMKQKDVMAEHKYQATAYSLLLGIDDVMFLYENRDMLNKKVYLFTPSRKNKDDLLAKICRALKCADKNEIPDKPLTADKTTCCYCNYKESCGKYK